MRRTSVFDVRGSYVVASALGSGGRRRSSSDDDRQQLDRDDFIGAEYLPTEEECQLLASPISDFLGRCTCYDLLGISTQVVVLDVDVPLTVSFIAAQETRINACVLWDTLARVFCGVVSSTDYIEILLHCHDNPQEVEQVSHYSVRQWIEKREQSGGAGVGRDINHTDTNMSHNTSGGGSGREGKVHEPRFTSSTTTSLSHSSKFVTCTPETPLSECLMEMLCHRVRRIAVLAEKEAHDLSVVAILDLQQILIYLGGVFLSIEAAGGGRRGIRAAVGKGGGNTTTTTNVNTTNSDNTDNNNNVDSVTAVVGVGNVGSGSGVGHEDVDDSELDILSGDMTLPPHVRNLLFTPCDDEHGNPVMSFGRKPIVGPYRAIVDVPFCYVPQLGKHRDHAIFVTLESPLLEALQLMLQYDIESLAVVSEERIIIDVIDRSDVVRIEDQGVYDTKLTVREALKSKVQAKRCVFHAKDLLRDIFIHFVRFRVRELFLVDPDTDKLLGQINVAEVLFFLAFGVTRNTAVNSNNSSSIVAGASATTV